MRLFAAASHVDPKFKPMKELALELERRDAKFKKESPTHRFDDYGLRVTKRNGVLVEVEGENDNLDKYE